MDPWQPIITDAHLPRIIVWRDRLLTIAMWLLLLFLMRHALLLLWDGAVELIGYQRKGPEPNWLVWWERLLPYLLAAFLLGVWLFGWALITVRRVLRSVGGPQPTPLSLEEEARRIGCSEAELVAWRAIKVCIVDIDEAGRIAVRSPAP